VNLVIGYSKATPLPAKRPSWNYRKEDDGGIISDMLVTGGMCWTTYWQRKKQSLASAQPISPSGDEQVSRMPVRR